MARRRRKRPSKPSTARTATGLGRVELLYQKKGDYLFGALYVIDESKGPTPTSGVFHISKAVGGKEIVYGSIANDLRRVWDILFRYTARQRDVDEQATRLVGDKGGLRERQVAQGRLVFEFPEHMKSPEIDRFLHDGESDTEDTLVLCSVHLRSILELFSGKIAPTIPVYDNQEKKITKIKLKRLMDTVLHHRYLVISGQYIVNLKSHEDQLVEGVKLGSRVDIFDVFDAIRRTVEEISINDVIGVLRSRLDRLSHRSKLNDIIFVVQNIDALSHLVEDRMTDPRNAAFLEFLLDDASSARIASIGNSHSKEFGQQPSRVDLALTFRRPSFKLVGEIVRKEIEVSCWIDGKVWKKRIPYVALFQMMSTMYGKDPVFVPKRSLLFGREDHTQSERSVAGGGSGRGQE